MSQLGARFIGLIFALVFFLPLGMINNGGRGIFIPSARWEAWASVAYVITLASMAVLVLVVHWLLVEMGNPKGVPATPTRIMLRVLTAFLLILLPVWVLGVVYGVFRAYVDGPVLERMEMAVEFDSYHESRGRRSKSHWVVLKSAEHGTFRISVDETPEHLLPREGVEVVVTGRRTWIGDRYDKLPLLEH